MLLFFYKSILCVGCILGYWSGVSGRSRRDEANPITLYGCPSLKQGFLLTFHGGPGPHTEELLSTLRSLDIPAVFFMHGSGAEDFPEVVRQIRADGYAIGAATFNTTISLTDKTSDEKVTLIRTELQRTENTLLNITSVKPNLFRPPQGAMDRSIVRMAATLGYTTVLWSAGNLDSFNLDSKKWATLILQSAPEAAIVSLNDSQHDIVFRVQELIRLMRGSHEKSFLTLDECLEG